jgi:hypothetical protein
MANTLIPIQTYTITSNASSIEFSNIPQNYTDLKIVGSARLTASSFYGYLGHKFNNSSTGYTARMVNNYVGTVYSETGPTTLIRVDVNADTSTGSTFGNYELYIPNYTGSKNKSCSYDWVTENNSTSVYSGFTAALWSNTAAISSIVITPDTGTIMPYSTFTLYGVSNGVKATGGTLTVAGGYAYHTFTSTGSLLPSQQITNAEILVIAGGGGGAGTAGGGGGAGGVLYQPYLVLKSGTTYSAVIGTGGAGTTSSIGTNGVNSSFGSYTAIGGGGGGINGTSNGAGLSGGSGGGGGYGTSSSSATGGTGTSGQGNTGGLGNSVAAGGGGGGGGAGTTGYPGSTNGTGTGGPGGYGTTTYTNWGAITNTGTNVGGTYYYAAGGGGGGAGQGGQAGIGGGGSGGPYGPTANVGSAGATNTGSGGGGTSGGYTGGTGGSGLVIVRYPLS